jgi:hypothetical protein
MKAKTYGIHGLSEWYGKVKAGSIEVSVSFKGGTASPSGAQPAYFMTKDPITQFVIENSKEFKNHFITLERSVELPGTHPREAYPKRPTAEEPVQSTGTGDRADDGESQAAGAVGGEKTQVKVSSVEDAKDYLVDKFGIASSKLRSRAACIAAGEENGIEFVWE